jgi:hypothetical protein
VNKKEHSMRIIKAVALAIFAVSTLGMAAGAVQDTSGNGAESILLSPTDKRYDLAAGSTVSDSFKIINDGQTEFNFVTYARPYWVTNEDYTNPDFDSKVANADAYKWVQFDKPSYLVKPGESVDVKYTLRVPENTAPGGHYGVLFAETQPTDPVQGTSVLRAKRVGAIMYVTVKGDITQSGAHKGVDVPTFQYDAPLKIRQKVSNSGNTDFAVSSSVRVYDVLGGLKYKADKNVSVLPGTTRAILNDWSNPAWIGVYRVEQRAKFLDTDRSATNYVVLVPLWVYLTLVLLIGGRVLYAVARHRRKK